MNKKQVALIALRVLLGILVLLNMWLIFRLSAQTAVESGATSDKVGETLSGTMGSNFEDKTPEEKEDFRLNFMPKFRKFAHAAEFGMLASLIYCLLLTWKGGIIRKYFISMGASVIYAFTDELHQYFTDGRNMALKDVGIDSIGIVVCASLILGIVYLLRYLRRIRS